VAQEVTLKNAFSGGKSRFGEYFKARSAVCQVNYQSTDESRLARAIVATNKGLNLPKYLSTSTARAEGLISGINCAAMA
jgi:hypothetical protein